MVEHFTIFENLVSAITSKMLRILTENINKVCRVQSNLYLISICSSRTLVTFENIAKNESLENRKIHNPVLDDKNVIKALF